MSKAKRANSAADGERKGGGYIQREKRRQLSSPSSIKQPSGLMKYLV